MADVVWHQSATIELAVSLPTEGGLPIEGKWETHRFENAYVAFREGFAYIRPDPQALGSAGTRVFVVPASTVKRAELPNGADEL